MFANLTCLVVEDSETQRRMLVRILDLLGVSAILEAENGRVALQKLEEAARPVDIVVTDLNMPGMDGLEFIRHLGKKGPQVSLIIASALTPKLIDSVATMTEAYGIRLLGAVEKPLTPGKLEPLLKLHMHRQSERQPLAREPRKTFTLSEIARGLQRNEFEPAFQPKVDLATGEVRSAEALARWHHPQAGIIAPQAFIGLLEANDLIDELTWIMISKTAAFCRMWRDAGLDVSVSVNLSLKSLSDIAVAERISMLVDTQNLDPRHLVLEITESAATTDVGAALENLARLRMKGFGLSIDDYGTGYSSMQQLTRIAFTELKIDRSFVTNAARQDTARVILQSSLDMARKLGITAVAEGVETQADWNLLRALGCNLAQGYLVAKPMEAASFPGWVSEWGEQGSSAVSV